MHLFFHKDIGPPVVELSEEEARHAVGVLRLRAGDAIGLLNGRGGRARAVIDVADKRQCTARIVEREQLAPERRASIHLAVGLTKQIDRFEWLLEKCTEIGVDRITPLITTRTERAHLRMDRLQKVLVSAMKQSQRSWLPRLDEATPINDLISGTIPAQRCFGWCDGSHAPFTRLYRPAADALMLIGPEGDFTPEEAIELRALGFQAAGLGEARLRTETAAVAACTWMNFAQQA